MTTRPTGVVCGLPYQPSCSLVPLACEEDLVRTESPASTLHCAVHGDVVDCRPSPPLSGVVHLNYGGGRGEWVRLGDGPLPYVTSDEGTLDVGVAR